MARFSRHKVVVPVCVLAALLAALLLAAPAACGEIVNVTAAMRAVLQFQTPACRPAAVLSAPPQAHSVKRARPGLQPAQTSQCHQETCSLDGIGVQRALGGDRKSNRASVVASASASVAQQTAEAEQWWKAQVSNINWGPRAVPDARDWAGRRIAVQPPLPHMHTRIAWATSPACGGGS